MLWCLGAGAAYSTTVVAENYRSFWLWAGVAPQPVLKNANEIYILAGEVTGEKHPRIISQRSATPHIGHGEIWIVYRAQTLNWNSAITDDVLAHIKSWKRAGNRIAGLQIDFDSGTRHLDRYVSFLKTLRKVLPQNYKLSITGLLDWSANATPDDLENLGAVADEVIIQTYQGRRVIAGYEAYLRKLTTLKVPFKIGLLQDGDWNLPAGLDDNPFFKGYVVFLLNGKP